MKSKSEISIIPSESLTAPLVTSPVADIPESTPAKVVSASSNSNIRQHLLTIVKILVSVGLLGYVLHKVGLKETLSRFLTAAPHWLLLSLVLYIIGVLVRAYRWQVLLAALDRPVRLTNLFWLYFVGSFFNQLAPSGIGGDVMRVYGLARDGVDGAISTTSVLMDRATGLYALFLMGSLAVIWQPQLVPTGVSAFLILTTIAITIAGISFFLLTRHPLGQKLSQYLPWSPLRKLYSSFAAYSVGPVIQAILISSLFNVLLIASNFLLAKALFIEVSIWYFCLFIPIISATLIIPTSVNGLGPREWAYVVLFAQAGVSEAGALALSLGFYALNLALALIGGGLLVIQNVWPQKFRQ
jgi:glycosyltransferase 2 family protein